MDRRTFSIPFHPLACMGFTVVTAIGGCAEPQPAEPQGHQSGSPLVSMEQPSEPPLPSSYTGGLSRVLDCSAAGTCAYDTTVKPIDENGTLARSSYAYAPAIVSENGVDHVFYCSHGAAGQGYDFVRYFNSNDMNIKVPVYSFAQDRLDLAACDPNVVFFGGHYYMFYSSAIQTNDAGGKYFQQNVLQIARAQSLSGQWETLNTDGAWEANTRYPKIIMGPARRRSASRHPTEIGLAWPSAVVKDGQIHLWFVDDSNLEESDFRDQARPYFHLVSSDPTVWARQEARSANLTGIHSGEVKFDPVSGSFMMFEIANAHEQYAFAQVRSSVDGEHWSNPRQLTGTMEGAHNIGIKADASGWLLPEASTQIMFGLPYGGRPKSQDVWTEWDLYTTYIRRR
jgi:hypothetical protein